MASEQTSRQGNADNAADYSSGVSVSSMRMEWDLRFHQAARNGNLAEIVRMVEEEGGQERLNERDRKGRTPLHQAIQAGQLNIVKYMIENGADINSEGDNKRQAIHFAAMTSQNKGSGTEASSVILYLLSRGVDINARDALGQTALHIAVMRGNKPAVFNLTSDDKADINAKDKSEITPLHLACHHGYEDIAEMLIGMGTPIQSKDSRASTPLHAAAHGGHGNIVSKLLREGKKLGEESVREMMTASDSFDWTPIHLLVDGGHTSIVDDFLKFADGLENKVDLLCLEGPNMDTPLHTACAAGHLPITKLLLEKGAQVESANWNNATPLHHACANDHADVAKYLLEKGADISARDDLNLTAMLTAADGGNLDTLRVLLEEGADIGNLGLMELFDWTVQERKAAVLKLLLSQRSVHELVTDDEIASLVLPAARNGSFEIIAELIRWKREVINWKDEEKNTPLHITAALGHDLSTHELVKAKANVLARNTDGQLPLHIAAENGWSRTAEVLLKTKSSVNAEDGHGCTSLHLAAMRGQIKMLKLLFSRGADVTIKDFQNLNCLDHAIRTGHEAAAMTILNHDRWWEMLCSVSNNNDTPMRELIRKMPGVAEKVMDNCVTVVNEPGSGPDGQHEEIEFNYELIDDDFAEWMHNTSGPNGVPDHTLRSKQKAFDNDGILERVAMPYTRSSNILTDNHPLMIMVSSQRESLLAHPLVSSLLNHKWMAVGRWLYALSVIVYTLFLTALTGYVIVTPPRYYVKNVTSAPNGESVIEWYVNGQQQWIGGFSDVTLFLFGELGPWLILALSIINLSREVCQMVWQRWSYLNWVNFLEVSLYILAILLVLPISDIYYFQNIMLRESWQWECGAVAVFLAWLNFILFTRRFSNLGIYVIMFTYILRTFLKIVVLLLMFLVAFALGFYCLLLNQTAFHDFGYSIMKVFTMLLGEFSYDDIFHGQDYLGTQNTVETDGEEAFFLHTVFHPPLTAIMFCLMLAVMPILFQNLLVGLAVDDIHGIKEKAKLHQLAMQVDLAMEVQRALPLFIWRSAIVSKQRLCAKPSRFEGLKGFFMKLNGDDDFLAKAMPIAKKPDKDYTIDSSLATMENMNDLRHRLRLLEKSIMELKQDGGLRSPRPTSSSVDGRRSVVGTSPAYKRRSRPLSASATCAAVSHKASSDVRHHKSTGLDSGPLGHLHRLKKGEDVPDRGSGGGADVSKMEARRLRLDRAKFKVQLDKIEKMLRSLVPPERRVPAFDDDDDGSSDEDMHYIASHISMP